MTPSTQERAQQIASELVRDFDAGLMGRPQYPISERLHEYETFVRQSAYEEWGDAHAERCLYRKELAESSPQFFKMLDLLHQARAAYNSPTREHRAVKSIVAWFVDQDRPSHNPINSGKHNHDR